MLLLKKIFRDLKTNKAANIAAIILVMISIMIFTMMSNVNEMLRYSKDQFYIQTKFADVFVDLRSISKEKVKYLEDIDGVEVIQPRIVKDFVIKEKDRQKKLESKYLRIFAGGDKLCTYLVEEGRYPIENSEIVIDPKFAKANGIVLGDKLSIISNGEIYDLSIVGIGRSAENIFTTKNASDIMPDPESFGIGYTDFEFMNKILGNDSYNSIVFSLKSGYTYEDVKQDITLRLNSYGIISQVEAKNQMSNAMMTQELDSLRAISKSLPMIFLIIASAVVYIMLRRLVELQRGQIGILKAFGFSDVQILNHYILYVLIMAFIGALIGALIGNYISNLLMILYEQFFNMPFILGKSSLKYIFLSLLMALIFSIFTGFFGAKEAISLSPSEAMRPKGPRVFSKKLAIENSKLIMNSLSMTGKIGLRNLGRNKSRGFFIAMGVAFTVSICAVPWTMIGTVYPMIYDRYDYVELYDLKIKLNSFREKDLILNEIFAEDIKKAEALIELPVVFRKANLKKESIIVGIDFEGALYTPVNDKKIPIKLNKGELAITPNIAEDIGAVVGDYVYIKSPYFRDKEYEEKLLVSHIEPQLMGSNGYMRIEDIASILGNKDIANGIILSAEDEVMLSIKDKYIESPYVESLNSTGSFIRMMEEMMWMTLIQIIYLGIVAIATGFAIIYNSTITIISERERELTSMMVIGMSEKEVFDIVSFEQWTLSFLGMFIAIPLTKAMLTAIVNVVDTDMYSMPSNFDIRFYFIAVIIAIIAIIMGQLAAYRKIKKLNLVDALKSNE